MMRWMGLHVATDWSHNDEPKGFACTDKSENGELKDSHLARDGTEYDMLKWFAYGLMGQRMTR